MNRSGDWRVPLHMTNVLTSTRWHYAFWLPSHTSACLAAAGFSTCRHLHDPLPSSPLTSACKRTNPHHNTYSPRLGRSRSASSGGTTSAPLLWPGRRRPARRMRPLGITMRGTASVTTTCSSSACATILQRRRLYVHSLLH